MFKGTIVFGECEHDGDLNRYEEDLVACGAKIIGREINDDSEEGYVLVEVVDKNKFMEGFKKTDSFGFSSLA